MKKLPSYTGVALVTSLFLTASVWAQSTVASKSPVATDSKGLTQERAVLDKYCAGCHNDKVKSGGFSMNGLDLAQIGAHSEIGEKMVRKLRSGMMPPSGMPRP